MDSFIKEQLVIFLWAVAFGAALSFVYDLLRAIRSVIGHHRIMLNIEAFLYWLMMDFFIFYYVYKTVNGSLRVYIFIGISVGIILYINIFSQLIVVSLSNAIISITEMMKPLRVIFKPFLFLMKKTIKVLKKGRKCLIIEIRKFYKELKILVKKI